VFYRFFSVRLFLPNPLPVRLNIMSSSGPTWFAKFFGSEEGAQYDATRAKFELELDKQEEGKPNRGPRYVLKVAGSNLRFFVGPFECPTVEKLESEAFAPLPVLPPGSLKFKNIKGDIKRLHQDPGNAHSVFQVASQFNCLEMVGPHVTPEQGVTRYVMDRTQGPACALCCPAGTVFRNYFVKVKPNIDGQREKHQLNLLEKVEEHLNNETHHFWDMKNGYCLPPEAQSLARLAQLLRDDPSLQRVMMNKLQVGVHWETQVESEWNHRVCQVFCSALPLAYARYTKMEDWEPFAAVVLEGAYRAVLATAVTFTHEFNHRIPVYLTALGGGAFGNPHKWIARAIEKALTIFRDYPLDVHLVHYNGLPKEYESLEANPLFQ